MNLKDIDPTQEYDEISEVLYFYIIERDNNLCQICGAAGQEIHHIIFRSKGGKHIPNELVLTCIKCHNRQHNLTEEDPILEARLLEIVEMNESQLRLALI